MLLRPPGTRNTVPLPGESCSCKCRHPSTTKEIDFIHAFQEPARIPYIIAGLSFYLFLSSGPQAHPCACVWQLPCKGRNGRVRGERVSAWVCFTMTPCKLPLTGTPSALLAKKGCDSSFNYWPLADQCLHMDCVNVWGYIKLITCNRFNCCTGNMSSAYLWKHSSSPRPTLPFILKT